MKRIASRYRGCVAVSAGAVIMLGTSVLAVPYAPAAGGVQIGLQPNHRVSVKPPGGGHGGGGGGSSSWLGWASSNWSGYAITSSTPFTGIGGNWTVPAVSATSSASYSAAWVGIDGFNNNSLIQTGTEQDYYNGAAHYAAWWTTSAQNFVEQPIDETVSAGDQITATISKGTGTAWTMTLVDTSTSHAGWSFTEPVTYSGPGASAEWIMEAPTVGGRVATLAQYASPTKFDPGSINGAANPELTASAGGELIQSSRHTTVVLSIPSAPDGDADGFNISYGSSAPSPPAS